MRKDPTEFRKRFQSWKLGIPAYRAGKPIGEDEDTRSDTTRQGYNEHGVPFDAGRGPAGDSPLKILDAVNEKYAAVHKRPGLVMGEPPAVGIGNPGMFNNSFLTKLFGSPSKAVGRQPMFMTDAVRKNTANLKSALMKYEGNAPSKLTSQAKDWIEYNKNKVDLSLFTAMDVNKLVKMNRADLRRRPDQFVQVTKGGLGNADYTFEVMNNGSSLADLEIGVHPNGVGHVAIPEMVSSFTKQPGMSRTLYDASILSGSQLGYKGLRSGDHLISAPKTWSVWEHYPNKKLVAKDGYHQNRMMMEDFEKDGKIVKTIEEAKKTSKAGQSFTLENGPVYILNKESLFVPVKSADVFDASILDANGVFNRNMNSTNIYKAMLPFAIGGGLWGSKEHKNGKDLPRFAGGVDLGANPTNATINNDGTFTDDYTKALEQGLTVTGKRTLPEYRSAYDPNVIRSFTDWLPGIGDIGQGLDAYNAFKNQDYLQAGILSGSMFLPSIIEKPGKLLMKFGLKYFPEVTKELYDISKLYGRNIEDNPRLRKYANEVSDLLTSDKIKARAFKHGDYNFMLANNIAKTPIAFLHANKTFSRPIINVLGKQIRFPIPIPEKYAGQYIPDVAMLIKRSGRTLDDIRYTAYHEASHASDKGTYVPKYYDTLLPHEWLKQFDPQKFEYLGRNSEKRARIISTLTDANRNGIDIDDYILLFDFTHTSYNNKNFDDLLKFYKNLNGSDSIDMLLGGYKNGKDIYIKPSHRGRLTALKKRTGKSEAELYRTGSAATRKMITFARNARKWKH